MASSSTIPQNIHDSHVKKEQARPTEDEPERINWEHEGESTEKKQEPKLSTLEEFRQYVIKQKLQSCSNAHKRNAGENAALTHSPALTTNTEKRKQNENLNEISKSMGNTHMPLLKSNTLHNNNLNSSAKLTLGINTTETKNPQDKSFENARKQDRGVVSHAEEAERSAVLAAAHRGATAIAGAEVLSRREQQDRDVVSHAEEAERSAVLAAAQSVHFVWGACGFYGGENVLGLREKRDSIASWPLRVGALDPKSVNSVEELAAVSSNGMSLDTGLGVSDEGNACATAVSRVNDAKLDGSPLTGGCELTQVNVRGGVLLAEETVSSLRVEAKETDVQSDMLGKVAVHPALRTGEVRATTIPHGEPLGDDSDDDIPIHPRYTFFGCLLSPFVCCMSRRQTQMARIEDPFSNE
ncbi:hypothetical protein TCSYLVIO_007320 [Trypanosoma cruzi]|nr:hypothetical protein TCSYLVIO_007320 [Trypanosoma cruzi]